MYESYEMLKFERRGHILTVRLENPPMNQMTRLMHFELSRVFHDINQDEETRVVVITGSGDRAFSAGGDINLMAKRIEEADHDRWVQGNREGKDVIRGLLDLEKPLLGRINGHAMGFGATLAAFCDISFMVRTAKIADSHVKVGLVAGDGGALLWPLKMGFWRAKEFLLTGDPLTGEQAAQYGLINRAVDAEELDDAVYGLAERLASGAPKAINGTKMAIHHVLKRLLDPSIDTGFSLETVSYLSADHKEAVSAFQNKRDPKFTGR
jgi:enoyl-CoA hydratase